MQIIIFIAFCNEEACMIPFQWIAQCFVETANYIILAGQPLVKIPYQEATDFVSPHEIKFLFPLTRSSLTPDIQSSDRIKHDRAGIQTQATRCKVEQVTYTTTART